MSEPTTIECKDHGSAPWNGEVVCGECGAVYQTSDHQQEFYWLAFCRCGVRLRPGDDRGEKYSARACCSKCYQRVQGTASPPLRKKSVQVRIYDPAGVAWVVWTEHDDADQALLSFDAMRNSMPGKPSEVFDAVQGVIAASPARIEQLEALVRALRDRIKLAEQGESSAKMICGSSDPCIHGHDPKA